MKMIRLIILCLLFPVIAWGEVYQADTTPWSGYWWPFVKGGLVTGDGYRGSPSPLEKYDLAVYGTKRGPAYNYGLANYYDPSAKDWEGMCFCWAAASILEPEPVHKGVYNNLIFKVGDKKGILTTAYDGTIFNKTSTTSPVNFHWALEHFIKDLKTPFMLDLGTNGEIWNYPIYKYDTTMTESGGARHYTTTIYYAEDAVKPDYTGTYTATDTFTYTIYVNGSGMIYNAEWTGDSVNKYPKAAYEPFGTECRNTGMTLETARTIAETNGDIFEGNQTEAKAAELINGTYDLLLTTSSDYFYADLKQGDDFSFSLDDKLGEYTKTTIKNPAGQTVLNADGDTDTSFAVTSSGKYLFQIERKDPATESEYSVKVVNKLPHRMILPVYPTGVRITGLAMARPDVSPSSNRLFLSLVDYDGMPHSGESLTGTSYHGSGLAESTYGLNQTTNGYIWVDADAETSAMSVIVNESSIMGTSFLDASDASSRIVFPGLKNLKGWQVKIGVINVGSAQEVALRNTYDSNGNEDRSNSVVLAPGQKIESYTTGISCISSSSDSLVVSTYSGNPSLVGYMTINKKIDEDTDAEALVPGSFYTSPVLTLPHVASGGGWETGVSISGNSEAGTTVTFSGYNGAGTLFSSTSRSLPEMACITSEISDLFPDAHSQIVSMEITTDNVDVSGYYWYSSSSSKQRAMVPFKGNTLKEKIVVPHIADQSPWWTGIGLMNTRPESMSLVLSLYDAFGKVKEQQMTLPPKGHFASSASGIFDMPVDSGFIELTPATGDGLDVVYLIGSTDGKRLMGGN